MKPVGRPIMTRSLCAGVKSSVVSTRESSHAETCRTCECRHASIGSALLLTRLGDCESIAEPRINVLLQITFYRETWDMIAAGHRN